jgi:hypothetical protein
VLTVPHRLRYLMAWDHKLCRAVLGVFVRDEAGKAAFHGPLRAAGAVLLPSADVP